MNIYKIACMTGMVVVVVIV